MYLPLLISYLILFSACRARSIVLATLSVTNIRIDVIAVADFDIWFCSLHAELDPVFWQQIRSTATEKDAAEVLGRFMDDVNAPGPDSRFPRPSSVLDSGLFRRDPELAALFTRTEVAFLEYYQDGRLSQRRGQALLDMLRHPEFDPNDFRSTDIVHLLRRLERPYAESTLHTTVCGKKEMAIRILDLFSSSRSFRVMM